MVIPRFDQRANHYSEHAFVQRELASWLAEWLPDSSDDTALEFGAGDGLFTGLAANRFREYTAIDIAPQMVEQGKARWPKANWAKGDAWSPERSIGTVDSVLSASLLQWASTPRDILSRWRRLLRPGGRTLNGFYVSPTLSELNELVGDELLPLTWRDADQWRAAFRDAGLAIVRSEECRREFRYRSGIEVLRNLHRVGAVTGPKLPMGRLRSIVREYDERFPTSEGVRATWVFFRIECRSVD